MPTSAEGNETVRRLGIDLDAVLEGVRQKLHEAVRALPNGGVHLTPTDLATDLAPVVAEMVCAAELGAYLIERDPPHHDTMPAPPPAGCDEGGL